MALLGDWTAQTWSMMLEAAPWLLGGFLLAGVIHVFLPAESIVTHLGKPGLGGVLKASLLGIPLPLCSCSVIPVASAIRSQGAGRGATASFLISTPETGIDSVAVSYALLGPVLAVARPVAAFLTAMVAGSLINMVDKRASISRSHDAATSANGCADCACEAPDVHTSSFAGKVVTAVRYGLGDLFTDLSHWLVLGFVLSGLVSAAFPAQFLEESFGSGVWPMLLMVVAGLPLYVCATSSTPLAAALIAKGLSPGAALVFLLVGPATNLATMVVVVRDLGRTSMLLYVLSIVVVAVLFGLGVDAVLMSSPKVGGLMNGSAHAGPGPVSWVAAVALAFLMLNGIRLHLGRRRDSRASRPAPDKAC
jgi:hypothetical protein